MILWMGQRNPNPQFFQRWMILSHDFVGVSTCFNMFQPSQIGGPGFRWPIGSPHGSPHGPMVPGGSPGRPSGAAGDSADAFERRWGRQLSPRFPIAFNRKSNRIE